MNRSRSLVSMLLLVLPVFTLAGLVWASYHFSLLNISGSGYSIQRIGIQALARSGTDPYSDEATAQIRSAAPSADSFVVDNYPRYTSPLYAGILVFPFSLISDKTLAHALWMSAQLIMIFAILLLSQKLGGWKPNWVVYFLFALVTIFSFQVIMPWLDGGLSIWAGFFLILALFALGNNRYEMGGVFLALTTVQPQMVILPIILILLWTISRKKVVVLLWFVISLLLLTVLGLFLIPGWVLEYARILYRFSENFPAGSPALYFSSSAPGLGKQLGWLISGIGVLILVIEWLLTLRKDFRWFLWTVCLTMVISQWIGIPTIPTNFIELLIPTVLIAALLAERWPRGGSWGAVAMAFLIFAWEWVVLYLDITGAHPGTLLNLIFPLPLVLLVGLYWVRWWAVKPRRLLIEELRQSEFF